MAIEDGAPTHADQAETAAQRIPPQPEGFGGPEETWLDRVVAEASARREVLRKEIAERLDEIDRVDRVLEAAGVEVEEVVVDFGEEGSGVSSGPEAAAEPETGPEPDEEPAGPEGEGEQAKPAPEPEPRKPDPPPTDRMAAAAERREQVVAYLRENGPSRKKDVGQALGIPDGSWGTMFAPLADLGVRRENVVEAGKAGKATYLALEGQEISPKAADDGGGEEPDDVPPPEPPLVLVELTAAMVRDAIAKTPRFSVDLRVFSAAEVARALPQFDALLSSYGSERALAEAIIEQLAKFVESGMIERVSQQGNTNRFRYVTPQEAAKRQGPVERSSGPPGPEIRVEDRRNGSGRGKPVAGAGKPKLPSDKEVADLIRIAMGQGYNVQRRGGHWIVSAPGGKEKVSIAGSPAGGRSASLQTQRNQLRSIGVAL